MDKETVIDNLYANYREYGVTKADLTSAVESGISNHSLSLDAVYNCLRMSLASAFGVHEYFTTDDVMKITGESKEELLQRIEQYRKELIEAGEDPDEYFVPVQPQKGATYYFPNGIKI